MDIKDYRVTNMEDFFLKEHDPKNSGGLKKSKAVKKALKHNIQQLARLQELLYADNRHGVLIILQAMDAAGKDGIIRHVMTGLNPQGVQVTPFKQPSAEELEHDYLWRAHDHAPERGNIAIFNRSYYEDVVTVRLHDLLREQNFPQSLAGDGIWDNRHRQIRDFERYLTENGITVVKLFLHLSKKEQKKRLLARIDDPDKHWKFSVADVKERQHWDRYQEIYETVIRSTATEQEPWHIIPADKKWFARLLVSEILVNTLERLDLRYPESDDQQEEVLASCRSALMNSDTVAESQPEAPTEEPTPWYAKPEETPPQNTVLESETMIEAQPAEPEETAPEYNPPWNAKPESETIIESQPAEPEEASPEDNAPWYAKPESETMIEAQPAEPVETTPEDSAPWYTKPEEASLQEAAPEEDDVDSPAPGVL